MTPLHFSPASLSLFVPHGAPTFALQPGEAGAALAAFAKDLAPRAIVIVSAHWETDQPTVGFAATPETIHDFWGFPDELYALHYPAKGDHEAATAVLEALRDAGIDAQTDSRRGLDHGAWLPLRLMFPEAQVPIVPLSIQTHGSPESHYQLGLALAPLAREGFLVIASGNLTHNLADYQRASMNGGQTPDYVRPFADWFDTKLQAHDLAALLDYRRQAPAAVRAHPRDEHLLPFYVALGAAGAGFNAQRIYAGVDSYVLAMDAFAFHSG